MAANGQAPNGLATHEIEEEEERLGREERRTTNAVPENSPSSTSPCALSYPVPEIAAGISADPPTATTASNPRNSDDDDDSLSDLSASGDEPLPAQIEGVGIPVELSPVERLVSTQVNALTTRITMEHSRLRRLREFIASPSVFGTEVNRALALVNEIDRTMDMIDEVFSPEIPRVTQGGRSSDQDTIEESTDEEEGLRAGLVDRQRPQSREMGQGESASPRSEAVLSLNTSTENSDEEDHTTRRAPNGHHVDEDDHATGRRRISNGYTPNGYKGH